MTDRFVSWKARPGGEKQDGTVIFRCTSSERVLIEAAAGQDRTLSQVIRDALVSAGVLAAR